jgi:hypothetical protein
MLLFNIFKMTKNPYLNIIYLTGHCRPHYTIIFTGCGTRELVFLPRIPLIPSDYHFQFKLLQFPIKVWITIKIDKA